MFEDNDTKQKVDALVLVHTIASDALKAMEDDEKTGDEGCAQQLPFFRQLERWLADRLLEARDDLERRKGRR